jgi:hypothetical protein
MPILHIRDENGQFVPIPAIKGDDGKSAYEQAVEGGFQGTEEEFIQLLASLSTSQVGSYTGDGSTERHISTGDIGNVLVVWSSVDYDFGALVMPSGAMFYRGGNVQTCGKNVCYFENGSLHICGNFVTFNETNKRYNYQVL